jgi:hypothetical protein
MKPLAPRAWVLVPLVLGLVLAGCATHRVDWGGRIGSYTYDQAILELGPPDKSATLTDGGVVAEWLERRGYNYGSAAYSYFPWWHGPSPPVYTESYSPDYFLRLVFDPEGKLKGWENFYK